MSPPGAPRGSIQEGITGDGPLTPVVLRLAGPVVMMMYLQGAYNIIDTIWVGQLLGKDALAGIATGGFVLWSIFGLTSLVSTGISAVVARRIGEQDLIEAERIAAKGLLYALVMSALVGVAVWLLIPSLFGLMGTGPHVTALGSRYLCVILTGSPFIFLSFMIHRIFQSAGDTVTPMWLSVFTLLLNTALDPVLMLGLAGFPRMGIAGAALATVIARLIMVASGLWLLLRKKRIGVRRFPRGPLNRFPLVLPMITDGYLGIRAREAAGWEWNLFGRTLRIGLPSALTNTMFPFVYMVLTRLPAAYGPEYVAALRIGHAVEGVSFFLAMGFSVAAATCIGQNMGAGNPERAARSAWVSCAIVGAVLLLFSVLFFLLPDTISGVFSSDPGPTAAGAAYLRILAVSQVFMGLEIVLSGAFAGAGDTLPPMAVSVPVNLARIPVAYLLAQTLGWGVSGVWWAISGTSVLKGVLIAAWFAGGGWKRKKV